MPIKTSSKPLTHNMVIIIEYDLYQIYSSVTYTVRFFFTVKAFLIVI